MAAATQLARISDINIRLPEPRVLILDDELDYLDAIRKNLELFGAEVHTASTVAEAKGLLEEESFQVVIADIFLEGSEVSGDEFIVENSQLMKGAKVAVVTGFSPDRIKRLNELDKLGVTIVQKGVHHAEALRELVFSGREKSLDGFLKDVAQIPTIAKRPWLITTRLSDVATRKLGVFLCHASNDKGAVRDLYQRLRDSGYMPWLDEESLIPGDEWEKKIKKAVRESDVVLVCLSQKSINKRGFVQKEIRYALDVADEQPEGTIFIIPLKLEECDVPERLRRWHWVNLFDENGYRRLTSALEKALASLQKVGE